MFDLLKSGVGLLSNALNLPIFRICFKNTVEKIRTFSEKDLNLNRIL